MNSILIQLAPYLPLLSTIVSILIVAFVLLQTRGAQYSGAFSNVEGGASYRRRGAELFLFRATFVLGILFAVLTLASLFAPR